MTENIIVIVISPEDRTWGEDCLLTDGNVTYSECSYWSSSPMDNYCFVLVNQDSDELKEDVSPLLNGTKKNMLIFWHGDNLDGLSDIGIDSNLIPCEHFSHGEENHPLKLFMQSVAALPCKDKPTFTPTCLSYSKYSDDCRGKFDKLVALYLGNPKAVLAKEFMISFGPLDLKLITLAKMPPEKKEGCLKKFHASNPGYLRKYEAFMAKASPLFDTDVVGKERFSQLCGEKICDFLICLDRKVGHAEIELFEWTEISSEIDSFHKWYCEVAKLLKGSAVCEDS